MGGKEKRSTASGLSETLPTCLHLYTKLRRVLWRQTEEADGASITLLPWKNWEGQVQERGAGEANHGGMV